VPEDHGGVGLGFVELAVLAEELGRVIAPGPLLPTVSQLAPVVREAGTKEQAARWLTEIAVGRVSGSLAVAEEGGWGVEAVSTEVRPAGEGWTVHGVKRHVLDAGSVTDLAVVARSPGTAGSVGIVVALVPRDAVSVVPARPIDASRGLATVVLDGVGVGPDRLLGEPSEGGSVSAVRRAVEEGTVALAVELVGTCQRIFDVALDYAKVRHQFGVPIGSFQAVKHKLANMFVALERARALCYFAAATIAEDDPRRSVATSMAKAAAGDCQQLVAQNGIQLLGGIGYTWEHDMHLYVKRAKSSGALFGSAAEHRAVVATSLGL
ncbi:MAG: acyl-CoA dehydrogenase family protein, partial [Chloroflexi bacterium]|nr:acyl-CoA dehydrogenase family protein [Chloroflexota bacterium]